LWDIPLEGSAFTAVLVNFGRVSIAAVTDVPRQLAESPYDVKAAAVVFNEADARLLTPERLTNHLTMRDAASPSGCCPPTGTTPSASARRGHTPCTCRP